MPYKIQKVRNKDCYRVRNMKTKRIFAKCTTMKKAQKQLRLLNAIEHNKSFVPRRAGGSKTQKRRK